MNKYNEGLVSLNVVRDTISNHFTFDLGWGYHLDVTPSRLPVYSSTKHYPVHTTLCKLTVPVYVAPDRGRRHYSSDPDPLLLSINLLPTLLRAYGPCPFTVRVSVGRQTEGNRR